MNFIDSSLESELSKGLKEVEVLLAEHIKGEYPLVVETSRHLVEAGGKRFRPMLTLIASHFGAGQNRKVIEAAVVCELTHVATLYHDDVMDEAPLRRGVESANTRWGNTVAILTGDYLFAKASQILADLGPEAVYLQAKTFERLVIGQIRETKGSLWSENELDHYLQVIKDKTGSLTAACTQFGAEFGKVDSKYIKLIAEFGQKIGVAFQLVDDVIDITEESIELGKKPGADLREGVKTLVTLKILSSNRPQDSWLKEKLKGPIPDEEIPNILMELRNHPYLDEAISYTKQSIINCQKILHELPDVPARHYLNQVCNNLHNKVQKN